MRVRPYIRYAERTKMRYDAVDRSCCDAINIGLTMAGRQQPVKKEPKKQGCFLNGP